jgi:hypothetical protein
MEEPPNNSLMLTRLAGEKAMSACLPPNRRENRAKAESPGSIARGRWLALGASPKRGVGFRHASEVES